MKTIAYLSLITALCVSGTRAAAADNHDLEDLPWETAYINLGYYIANLDSSFRVGGDNLGVGIDINVEEFLGLESTNTAFRIDAGYRFGKRRRHRMDFSWFGFDRDAVNTLDQTIELPPELGGGTIDAGATVGSIFNFDIVSVKYRYSYVLDDRIDLNLGGGLYVMPIKFGVRELNKEGIAEDITAPLPVVTIGFDLAVTPEWHFMQGLDMMYLKLGNFEGRITSTRLGLEYRGWDNVAVGAGIDGILVKIDAEDETDYPGIDFIGSVKFSYFGLQTYIKFYY